MYVIDSLLVSLRW